MSELYDKLNSMTLQELELLLESTEDHNYNCDREVFLALVIKLIKKKQIDPLATLQVF